MPPDKPAVHVSAVGQRIKLAVLLPQMKVQRDIYFSLGDVSQLMSRLEWARDQAIVAKEEADNEEEAERAS